MISENAMPFIIDDPLGAVTPKLEVLAREVANKTILLPLRESNINNSSTYTKLVFLILTNDYLT